MAAYFFQRGVPYGEGSITYEIYLDDRFGKPEPD